MKINSSHRCILLTGATGFLGSQVARRLVQEPDLTLIALVHAESQTSAEMRISRAWWDWPELHAANVEVLAGDVTLPNLGLDDKAYARLAGRITHIIHAAADLRVDAPLDEMRKTNVQGSANILQLARQATHIERYSHISTAYVAGARSGTISEADLTAEHGFSNAYEESKYEGERLVQDAKNELPISIFRPGMIVGASDTGEIRTFNTFYFPLRLYLTGKLRLIPADPALPVNLVPVDYVAEAIVRLTFNPEAKGLTFHLTAPADSLPKAGELIKFVRAWGREHLDLRLPQPWFIRLPLPRSRYGDRSEPSGCSNHSISTSQKLLGVDFRKLAALGSYFNENKQFQRDNVDRLIGLYALNWREFLPILLAYAVDQGFMHRTERTVHEQLLARLQSKTRPVNYFDIVQGKIVHHSAAEVRGEILAAAGALTALGIQPGDRVAIVGLNSTRYLILDTAIGLVGAVSVPLYYTSPAAEINAILSASGARLLLVGAPKILSQVDEIKPDLPIVSFTRGPLPADLRREVTSWETFLTLGAGTRTPLQSPVGFGDLATLRYTSGTTGQPKGVSFQHHQLRWMGVTMASLLPWKSRNRPADYLSFLPMNHVVEGILATYSPYYLPAAVNIYFLEGLKEIQHALPRVRPTIFFSVPRIYEKIWEALEKNPVGRHYLDNQFELEKRFLGKLLRWQTLRKTGLDKCAQLIAGSAPMSEGLLQNFRELGIEIHNAYGLTEAPLVTLNRLGANRLGTVGEPLPQTAVRVSEDGEVWVRGPQVMAGYYGELPGKVPMKTLQDGWLATGDLGSLTPEGSLVLNGRKKELFKTSYGKYIQPAKVESRLREIPGVAEALLVGEEKPYCVALLWVQDQDMDVGFEQRIDRLVTEVNHGLSHPEQVKRWAVLSNDLSIEAGDMTANLKLKRQAITLRLRDVLNDLYSGIKSSQAVLHVGNAERG